MPVAVELFFDDETDAAVRALWRDLHGVGVPSPLIDCDAVPHVSIAVYESVDLRALERAVRGWAATARAEVPVTLSSLGLFPGKDRVIFLGVTMTPELLHLHGSFHRDWSPSDVEPWRYYLPGIWVPHCTLGYGYGPEELVRAILALDGWESALRGRLTSVGITHGDPCHSELVWRGELGSSQ